MIRGLFPNVLLIVLTATATDKVKDDILEILITGIDRPNLSYYVRYVENIKHRKEHATAKIRLKKIAEDIEEFVLKQFVKKKYTLFSFEVCVFFVVCKTKQKHTFLKNIFLKKKTIKSHKNDTGLIYSMRYEFFFIFFIFE